MSGSVTARIAAALLLTVAATRSWADDATAGATAERRDLPSMVAINIRNAELDTRISGLDEPWAFEFLGLDEVLITETRGRLLRARLNADAPPTEVTGLPPIVTGRQQTGFFDIALHPEFDDNARIYFSYAEADRQAGRYYRTQVATAVLSGDRLTGVTRLLEDGVYGWSPSNFGGALEFDGDGRLLITMGDRSDDVLAQRGDRLEGKILRLDDDGTIPADNPFVDDPDIDDRIFALGVRNAQGMDRDPVTESVFFAEHGPLGGDEVNLLREGANYGWPEITYGRNYSGRSMGVGTHAPGFEQPLFFYLPSEAISPLLAYRGEVFDEWNGDLLVGALKGKHVSRLVLDGVVVRSEYPILGEIGSRIRDLQQGPDDAVYILTQDGALLRLGRRGPGEPAATPPNGQKVYRLVCAGCHDTGAADAPTLDDGCRWKRIADRPRAEIYRNTLRGIGEMPERGLCHVCSDAHLERAVDYMLERASECNKDS